ncbi:MAG: hypothetical protein KDD15_13860 [Lewinella sp.]|nr:hypothetical protein [Lewinella sp.]
MAKLSLPNFQSPHLRNDAPMLRIMNYAVFGFILLSSLTVFLGLRSYMSEYMAGYDPLYRYIGYGTAYIFGALIPDFANATIIAWLVRSLLIGDYKSVPAKLILLAALLICYLLATYSFNMSQISAGALVDEFRGETQLVDIAAIDNTTDARIKEIQRTAEQEYKQVEKEYDHLIATSDQKYIAELKPYSLEIERLERNRKPSNTEWTDREIAQQRMSMQPIAMERLAEQNRLTEEKNSALQVIRQNRRERERTALAARDTTFSQESNLVQATNLRKDTVSEELKYWIGNIAGFAVWVMLALVAILQVLRVRNEQLPVYIPANRLIAKFGEVVAALPYLGGTLLLHAARRQYQRAAKIDLPPPPTPHRQWDYGSFRPELLPFKHQNRSSSSSTPSLLPVKSEKINGNKPGPGLLDKLIRLLYQNPEEDPQPAATAYRHDNTNRDDNINRDTESETPGAIISDKDEVSESTDSANTNADLSEIEPLSENNPVEKPSPTIHSDNTNRANNNTNRGVEPDVLSETEIGEGGIKKIRIGRKWYTRRQCSKKLSDARRGAKNAVTEKARQRNLDRIKSFEQALQRFDQKKTERDLVTV